MFKEVITVEKGKAKRYNYVESSKMVNFNSNTIDNGYNFKY